MKGYKALETGLVNRYGFQYEIGNTYILDGDLEWRKNGFHFCSYPEDTLRYVNGYNDNIVIVRVDGSGQIIAYDDEYYGFYDMYASSIMKILRVVPRKEVFNQIINSGVNRRIERFITLTKLSEEEKKIILNMYPDIEPLIKYYQNEEYVLKRKRGY